MKIIDDDVEIVDEVLMVCKFYVCVKELIC